MPEVSSNSRTINGAVAAIMRQRWTPQGGKTAWQKLSNQLTACCADHLCTDYTPATESAPSRKQSKRLRWVYTNSPANYILTYTTTNALGGTATTTRTVVVRDSTSPTITVN